LGTVDGEPGAPQYIPDDSDTQPGRTGGKCGEQKLADAETGDAGPACLNQAKCQNNDACQACQEQRQDFPACGICPALGVCHVHRVPCKALAAPWNAEPGALTSVPEGRITLN